ncbi:MAG TPA: hypothetical protein VD965_07010 [Burkholderiales bacterium]|nr:hypothetical protein [Burkholderiales bacterium]
MPRLTVFLMIAIPWLAYAGEIKLRTEGWKLRHALQASEPRYTPPVKGHLTAGETTMKKDSCVFVAGVRHCPLPELRPALPPAVPQ